MFKSIDEAKIAKFLTAAIMITALIVSFLHIVMTFTHLGADWDRWVAPFMIDTIAVIGKIYSGSQFTAATRRAGRAAFYVAGTLSLVANVLAGYWGNHYGSMIIGVVTVSAALWGEGMISKGNVKASAAQSRQAARTQTTPTAKDPKRSAAAKKAAATRAANKAAAATLAAKIPVQRMAEDSRAYL